MLLCFRYLTPLPFIQLVLFAYLSNYGAVAKSSSRTTFSTASTCASKTLNYITATLPQQCLRTSWSSERAPNGEIRQEDPLIHKIPTESETSTKITTTLTSESSVIELPATASQSSVNASVTITSDLHGSATPTLTPPYNDTDAKSPENVEADSDPLSDNASFLSFEEWKAQMLQKAGQSPEHVSGTGNDKEGGKSGREPGGINNALDSLGEEGEIEIEFGGFVTPDAAASAIPTREKQAKDPKEPDGATETKEDRPKRYSKEAGTTSKQRFNYASFDCAATVRKTNPDCKGPTSILLENKDSYMLNTCSTNNKFLIVELCNDILIDTIVLGNFEFFSSTFKEFRVSVSDRYPVKSDKWKEIGTFEARNTRGVQAFLVENGVIWARYLRIEFLSHYGKEYYCPVSLLRVHGKTMMDDYRADVKASRGEEDNDDEDAEDEPAEKVVAEPLKGSSSLEAKPTDSHEIESNKVTGPDPHWQDTPVIDKCPRKSLSSPLIQQAELFSSTCERSNRFCNMATVYVIKHRPVSNLKDVGVSSTASTSTPGPEKGHAKTEVSSLEKKSATTKVDQSSKPATTDSGSKTTASPVKPKDGPAPIPTDSLGQSSKSGSKNAEPTGSTKTQSDHPTASGGKIPSTAIPATQESFFKSVHKRLQQLEANSTLSLQYIEEQSRILREAFTKVEKRQLSKTSTFLETLNVTVLSELREFRLQYDQIWQSTVLELSSQREQSQKEVTALSQRLTLLADEILWQKRIAYLQFGLILLCLGLAIFPRNPANPAGSFDLQSMVGKPTASFARYLNLDSPPGTPSRPGSRYGLFNRRMTYQRGPSQDALSDEEGIKAPNIEYQLPTPTPSSSGEEEQEGLDSLLNSPDGDPPIRRAQSTPNLAKESDDLLESPEQEEAAAKQLGEETVDSPE